MKSVFVQNISAGACGEEGDAKTFRLSPAHEKCTQRMAAEFHVRPSFLLLRISAVKSSWGVASFLALIHAKGKYYFEVRGVGDGDYRGDLEGVFGRF